MLPDQAEAEEWFSTGIFDHIFAREPWRKLLNGSGKAAAANKTADCKAAAGKSAGARNGKAPGSSKTANSGVNPAEVFKTFAEKARRLLPSGGDLVLLQSPPRLGERISRILAAGADGNAPDADKAAAGEAGAELVQKLREAEESFFAEKGGGAWTWDGGTLKAAFEAADFTVTLTTLDQKEERLITERDLAAWFDQEHSRWGAFIGKALGKKDFTRAEELMRNRIKQGPIVWQWQSVMLKAK
jgi:putative ATPase